MPDTALPDVDTLFPEEAPVAAPSMLSQAIDYVIPQFPDPASNQKAVPPDVDQLFPPPPPGETAAEGGGILDMLFGRRENAATTGQPFLDAAASLSQLPQVQSTARVIAAFLGKSSTALGKEPYGLSPQSFEWLKSAGMFNNWEQGEQSAIRAFNEALIVPSAAGLDATIRGSTAVFVGAQEAVQQAFTESGAPRLGRDVAAMPEAFFGQPFGLGHARVPVDIKKAESLGVIGTSEEWFRSGRDPMSRISPRPVQAKEVLAETPPAVAAEAAEAARPVAAEAPTIPAMPDVHAVARQIEPEVFRDYDAMSQRRDTFRNWLADLAQYRDQQARENAPHAAEIADLQKQSETATPRLQKKYQARLEELTAEQETYIADHTAGDTADMALVRNRLQETDYAMRDMAPQVSDAYRRAREMVPEEVRSADVPPEARPVEPAAIPARIDAAEATTPPVEARPAEPLPAPDIPEPVRRPTPTDPLPVNIAEDVATRLAEAGRPAEEAAAAAAIVDAHYQARAARFGGARGTAEELYAAEAPRVKAGEKGGRGGAAAGKATIRDGKTVITLFKKADASTFMHETGHHWLEELMADSRHSLAPAELKADADAVLTWLGVDKPGAIGRKQHEQFARGFEAYMMEGRAPTSALAKVFEQFRQWLLTIYQSAEKLKVPLTNDIRDVYNRLISRTPDNLVIARDQKKVEGFAERHSTLAESTTPDRAIVVADSMRVERDAVAAKALTKEENDARLAGFDKQGRSGNREGEARGPEPASDVAQPEPAIGETGGIAEPGTIGESRGQIAPQGGGAATIEAERPQPASIAEDPIARPRPEPARPPESAHDPLSSPADVARPVDKAGNIRLDTLNTPEDINAVLRQTAEANGDFVDARRGVIADAEVLNLADALGMDAASLDRRKIGEAFNAEQVVAARKLLIHSATEVRDAMVKAATGSDADVLAYATTKERHIMIQRHVSGVTAEAGRALRAFREIQGSKEAKAISEFVEVSTGKTLFQLKEEAALGASLDTPSKVSKFLHDSRKVKFSDMALEFWINALLSGPKTHVTNILSNSLVAMYRIPETAIAGVVGAARRVVTGSKQGVFVGEAWERLFGIVHGARDGVVAGWDLLKNEDLLDTTSKLEQRRYQAIPGRAGQAIRVPGRMLAVEDQVFKGIAYRQEINAQAYRLASEEGLTGDAFVARIAELRDSPTEAMMAAAKDNEVYQTFNKKLGKVGSAVQQFANAHPLAKVVIPFVRTPMNIVKFAQERSIFGLFAKEVRDNLAGVNGTAARDTQIARITLGSAVSIAAVSLAAEGNLTGGGPTDPKKRAALYLTGWQPYSVKIGGIYYSYARMEPLGTLLGIAADMTEVQSLLSDDDHENIAKLMLASTSKNLVSKTWLRGPSDLIQAISDPDRYGGRYVDNLVGSLIPTGAAQIENVRDPYLRQARGLLDKVKSRVPGLSDTLFPRRDVWGEPIKREGGLGPDLVSPIGISTINSDPVNAALLRLKFYPSPMERKIRGVELTDQQYDDFARIGGRTAKMRLDAIVAMPGFSSIPEFVQRNMMVNAIKGAHESARTQMMISNPQIIQDAMDAKTAKIDGRPKPKPRQ